ncbi:hypothetical protein PISMIDRAFT_672089 [Pisolithus microcarpus 441]|uniref:Uncharacterized protein n=1 Tax=Pisolithus microcarpus 441 TaxID=765257 RepID=A0A0C9YWE0_9AGAM|nr:hypothetical protein PISMIDRAFT_672089 [Pisolithus microcarpus 441]
MGELAKTDVGRVQLICRSGISILGCLGPWALRAVTSPASAPSPVEPKPNTYEVSRTLP